MPSSEDQLKSEIHYDNRLDSYTSFFDHAWAKRFLDESDMSLLEAPAHDLCRDWKGIAISIRMPWLLAHAIPDFHKAFTTGEPTFLQQLTRQVGKHIADKSTLSNMRKKELIAIVQDIGNHVQQIKEQMPTLDVQTVWNDYLQVQEMGWGLWASQWLAYAALYFSYENYLRQAVSIARNETDYRATVSKLRKDCASVFGDKLTKDCIDDPDIQIARLARHCIAHAGSKESPELRKMKHNIIVTEGRLQIFPENVRALFSVLTDRVLKIAVAAQSIRAFKRVKPKK